MNILQPFRIQGRHAIKGIMSVMSSGQYMFPAPVRPSMSNDFSESNLSAVSYPASMIMDTNLNMAMAGTSVPTVMTWDVAFKSGYLACVCLIAVLANFLVAYTLVRKEQLLVPSNRLVFNLTASNFVFSMLILPFIVLSIAQQRWMFGIFWCNFTGFITLLVGIASILTSAMIAVDRYYAIVKPMVYARTITVVKSTAMLLWVWIQATVCSLPPLFGWSRFDCLKAKATCSVVWRDEVTYTSFLLVFCIFMPFSMMIACYYHIFQVVRSKCRKINVGTVTATTNCATAALPMPQPTPRRLYIPRKSSLALLSSNSSPTKGFRTICIVIGMFLLTWVPYAGVAIADVVFGPLFIDDMLRSSALCLLYTSSVGYPIVYGVYNRSIRKEIRTCLCPPSAKVMKGLPRRNSRRLSFSNGGLFEYTPFRGRNTSSSLSAQPSFNYGRASIDLGSLPAFRHTSTTRRPSQDSGAIMTESDMDTDFSFLPSYWFGRGSGLHNLPAKLGFLRRRPSSPAVGTREPFPILQIVDLTTGTMTNDYAEVVADEGELSKKEVTSEPKVSSSKFSDSSMNSQQRLADIPSLDQLPVAASLDNRDKVLDFTRDGIEIDSLFIRRSNTRMKLHGPSIDEGIVNDCILQDPD